MIDEERIDPADQLRSDIESAIEEQQPKETDRDPIEPEASEGGEPDKGAVARDDRRDEKGRFVAKDEAEPAEPREKAVEAKVETAATDEPKATTRPPPGFSVASKSAWDALPQSVRDDIAKREQEVDNGFKRYSGLGKFAEEAERNGTTLQNAVNDYVGIEGALRQDPLRGIEFICQRMGMDPRRVAQAMAARYNAAPQNSNSGGQPSPIPQPQQPVIDPNAIAQHVAQVMRVEAAQKEAVSQVSLFGADPKNKFFANVRPVMAKIVQAGTAETIEQAYEAACWMNPEIRAVLVNEANGGRNKDAEVAASRSRAAAKAVGGSPAPGVNPDATGKRQNLSLEDEIRSAIDAQSGAA